MASAAAYIRTGLRFVRLNKLLVFGISVLVALVLFGYVGSAVVDRDRAKVGAFDPALQPNSGHWLGTQKQGRDVLTVVILATPNTIKVGLMAGAVGLAIGIVLGLASGYFGGIMDTIVRIASDVVITIPGIAIMVIVAVNVRTMSTEMMALIVASLAWMWPTRAIRAQALTLRERGYVEVAKLNGVGGLELVLKEIFPNLLPYVMAGFVGATSGAILATIGLEALGLGPQHEFTLGMMVYWGRFYGAILRGMWWWWAPPIGLIVLIFIGLLFTSFGLDQIANPRTRRAV